MPDGVRKAGRLLRSPAVRVATAGGLFALLFAFVPVREVGSAIVSADPRWILAGWALTATTPLLAARQLRFIAAGQGLTSSTWDLLRINLATHFYSLFLPGYLAGGAIRWYRISRKDRKPTEALACIGLNRLIDTAVPVSCGLACWSLDRAPGSPVGPGAAWVLLGLVLTAAVGLAWKRPWSWMDGRVSRLAVPGRLRDGIARMIGAILRHHDGPVRDRLIVVAISALRFTIDLVVMSLFARAIGIEVSILTLGWIRSIIGLLVLLPISVSGIGVREGGLAMLLLPYGVGTASAVALSVLVFSQVLLKALAGALVECSGLLTGEAPPPPLEADR